MGTHWLECLSISAISERLVFASAFGHGVVQLEPGRVSSTGGQPHAALDQWPRERTRPSELTMPLAVTDAPCVGRSVMLSGGGIMSSPREPAARARACFQVLVMQFAVMGEKARPCGRGRPMPLVRQAPA